MLKILNFLAPTTASLLIYITGISAAFAAEYGYHPSTPFRLGAGLNPSDPLEAYPVCFDHEIEPVPGTSGSSLFRLTLLESRRDFLREMSLSASMSGQYKFFSGGASVALDEGYSFSSDSLTWTVYLTADFGRQALKNETPNAVSKALLDAGEHEEFATRCGTELVVQERRTALVAAVFSVSNLSESRRRSLAASLNASASAGIWSAAVSANYSEFVSQAAQTSQINLSVVTIGGPGGSNLANLIKDYGDLSEITAVLSEYAKSFTFENAVSSSFLTASMERYGWNGEIVDLDEVNFSLGEYYYRFQEIQDTKSRAEELLKSHESKLSAAQKAELRSVADNSLGILSDITKAARNCRDTGDCVLASTFEIPRIVWPLLSPLGNLGALDSTTTCDQLPKGLVDGVNFFCRATYRFRAAGKWERISKITVLDESGNELPLSSGEILTVREFFDKFASSVFGSSITEQRFLREFVGDGSLTIADAEAAGWRIRVFGVDALFGASEKPTRGIRRAFTGVFSPTDEINVIERQLIVE